MRRSRLILRSLTYYWRSHLAVVLGVAAAVSVLAGALVVGDSVRTSLRELFLGRLGQTDDAVFASGFFRDELSEELRRHPLFEDLFQSAAPLVMLEGVVTAQMTGRRASQVQIYGVDDRFWNFHGFQTERLSEREVRLNSRLASELGSEAGDAILVSVENPSAIPLEFLHGRRQEVGRTMRYVVREILPASGLGAFSLRAQQASVRAVFVPLSRLQRDLEVPGQVNVLLLSRLQPARAEASPGPEALRTILRDAMTLDDLGLRFRELDECDCLVVESSSTLFGESIAGPARTAAERLGMQALPMFTYLANAIRTGDVSVPYSLVTAVDLPPMDTGSGGGLPPIWLNAWAAQRLKPTDHDEIVLEYYLWNESGELAARSARFQLAGVVPVSAADRHFAPPYTGISDVKDFANWDPPFPIDLSRIHEDDEQYWDQYRTTPKALIPLEAGRQLWGSRFGEFTSVRIFRPGDGAAFGAADWEAYKQEFRSALDPLQFGFWTVPVRAAGIEASEGATDFGEFFLYFSFFLMVSALLLTGLFFRLGIEQRLREIGLLRALGFPPSGLNSIFLSEGLILAAAGSALGVLGAWIYGALIMLGLRTWWIEAVGTTELSLHMNVKTVFPGVVAGIITAFVSIAWSLRRLLRSPVRGLLSGTLDAARPVGPETKLPPVRAEWRRGSSLSVLAVLFTAAGLLLVGIAVWGVISEAAGFFGAGLLILVGLLMLLGESIRRGTGSVYGNGLLAVGRLGMRNASHRPGRSILCIAFIASASFIIVAVEAFRHESSPNLLDRRSGTGGFSLLATSVLPILHDPNRLEGAEALNLPPAVREGVVYYPLRVRPGEDVSCLNLYRPQNPRILGVPGQLVQEDRFLFQSSLAETPEERENPWLLLEKDSPDESIPVIADATSLRYVLHRELGETIIVEPADGEPIRLRVVAALADSLFQGELLMSERHFLRHFPEQQGYRFFLLDAAPERSQSLSELLEESLADFGFNVTATAERLAEFHRVENTYLSTFQLLGGLGLILGTAGLATVLLRNVLERRKELALLRAIGYQHIHFSVLVIAENALLLSSGLLIGLISALLAITPALIARGASFPELPFHLLGAVVIAGIAASILAARAAVRSPLLPVLKEDA